MSAAAADLARLMNQARTKLPGASDSGLIGELYDVFQEFFNDSGCWLEVVPITTIPPAGTAAAVTAYTVTPAQDGQIIRLAGIADVNGTPQAATMTNFGVIDLGYPPSTVQVFNVTVVKTVVLPTDKNAYPIVPNWVLPVYGLGILDGLLGKMMGHIAKSYSNETMSVYHLKRFRDHIARARIETYRRHSIGVASWGFPHAFRTRGQKSGVSIGNNIGF